MKFFQRWRKSAANTAPSQTARSVIGKGVEKLEDRLVLAIDPATPNFVVNEFDFGTEAFSTAGIDDDGDMVVAFERIGASDPDLNGIWFQLFDPDGTRVVDGNGDIIPNIQVTNNGRSASVAMYDERIVGGAEVPGFAVIWAANELPDSDPLGQSDVIYLQRFNEFGVADGNRIELARSTNPNLTFEQPMIDSTPTGALVAIWRVINPQVSQAHTVNFATINGNDALGFGTVSTDVDPPAVGNLLDPPALAVNDDGNFIVGWVDANNQGAFGNVFVQRFNAVGSAAGAPILVDDSGFSVDVDLTANRSFVVAWQDVLNGAPGPILHQRFDSNANPLASANPVMLSNLDAAQPNVVVDEIRGTYTIGASTNSLGGGNHDVFIVQFEADGTRVNSNPDPFPVVIAQGEQLFTATALNSAFTRSATKSQMAINDAGDFIVTWWGNLGFDLVGVAARKFLGDRTVSITGGEVDEPDTGVNATITFTATISDPAPVPVQVWFETQELTNDPRRGQFAPAIGTPAVGADFVTVTAPPPAVNGVNAVVIPAGQTSATFTVTVIGDDTIEQDEAFGVQLLTNPGRPSVTPNEQDDQDFALGVIIDNDTPRVSISDGVPFPAVEGTDAFMTFTVTLTKTPNEGNLVLSFQTADGTATAGQDYLATSGILTFAQGTTDLSQVIVVPIIDDDLSEPVPPNRTLDPDFVETFSVVVTAAPANNNPTRIIRGTGIGAIRDNEPAQIIAPLGNLFSIVEGDVANGQALTFLLNKPATVATNITVQTIDGIPPDAAVAGVDYVPILSPPPADSANTISIAAGQTEFNVGVVILGNETPQRDRTFFVQLTVNPAELFLPGGIGVTTATFAVQILDDDGIAVFLIDVSDSMDAVRAQDVTIDGEINKFDDLNGDGEQGTLIDQAIQQASIAFTNSVQRRGSIIIFAKTPQILDFSAAPGLQSFVRKGTDENANGQDEFSEVLRTIRIGQGGLYNDALVDPTKTYYEYALNSLFTLGVQSDLVSNATILTDGSGLLASNSPALAAVVAAQIPVSSILLGPYSLVGPTTDIDLIVAATNGTTTTVDDFITPLALPTPLTVVQSPVLTPVLPSDLEGAPLPVLPAPVTTGETIEPPDAIPVIEPPVELEEEVAQEELVDEAAEPAPTEPILADPEEADDLDTEVAQEVVLEALDGMI